MFFIKFITNNLNYYLNKNDAFIMYYNLYDLYRLCNHFSYRYKTILINKLKAFFDFCDMCYKHDVDFNIFKFNTNKSLLLLNILESRDYTSIDSFVLIHLYNYSNITSENNTFHNHVLISYKILRSIKKSLILKNKKVLK